MGKKQRRPVTPPQEFKEESAGGFTAWLAGAKRAQNLKVLGNDVPCGECIACCRASMFIHVRADETDALRHIPKPLLFPAPGAPRGHVLLGFNERGECPMLHEGRCSIYEHRPQTCRDFDCRVLAATGILPDDDGPQGEIARRARSWRFELAGDQDREQHSAVQAAGAFLREQRDAFPEGALPFQPVQLAVLALEVYELFTEQGLESAPRSASEIAREVLALMDRREPPKPRKRAR
jgi:uncharacterized protein